MGKSYYVPILAKYLAEDGIVPMPSEPVHPLKRMGSPFRWWHIPAAFLFLAGPYLLALAVIIG